MAGPIELASDCLWSIVPMTMVMNTSCMQCLRLHAVTEMVDAVHHGPAAAMDTIARESNKVQSERNGNKISV